VGSVDGGEQDPNVVEVGCAGELIIVWSVPLELTQQIKLEPGAPYSLFGGNVTGKVQEVKKAESLVQSWQPKMPGWPSDHYGTMRLAFKQGESSTKGERAIRCESGTQADQQ